MNEIIVTDAEYGTTITNIGNAKILAAVFSGKKVTITHAAVGDGGGAYYYPTKDQIGLVCEQWRGEISRAEINPTMPNMYDVEFAMPPDIGGFTIREASIIDEDGDTIAITNCPPIPKISTQKGVNFPFEMLLHFIFENVDGIQFSVNASLDTVTRKEMEKALKEVRAGVGSAIIKDITIPSSVWTATADAGKYKFVADLADADVLDAHFPSLALTAPSLDAAFKIGLCPTIEALDGILRLWAMRKPITNLAGTLQLRSENAIPVEVDAEITPDNEANEVIEDIFG